MASFGRDTNIGYPDANSTSTDTLLASILATLSSGITVFPVSAKGSDLDTLISILEHSLLELRVARTALEITIGQDLVDEEVE